jgi:VWFA-related protein
MRWLLSQQQHHLERLAPLFIILLLAGTFSPAGLIRGAQPSPDENRDAKRKSQPAPTPFIQHEEVRFVTLDLVVEQRGGPGGKGWHFARDLTKEQVHLFLGSQEMVLDMFENWCGAVPPGRSPETVITADSKASHPSLASQGTTTMLESESGTVEGQNSPHSEPHKYILYFDLQQLTTGGRDRAFQAAIQWAQKVSQSSDEVMILTGGLSLRIVRPMLPASLHLIEDLEAARQDTRAVDMWAQGEESRIQEILRTRDSSLARLYASIDYDIARRSLENMSQLMAIFGDIPGTKDLVYFSETLRLFPGSQYPFGPSPKAALSREVARPVYQLAARANERNIRIYAVQASGLEEGRDIEEPLFVLSEETGGRSVHGTNNLGAVFDRTEEDFSCFYRVGFRMPSEHSGNLKTILVRIGEHGRGYRVRHRRSVDDPTRQTQELDRLSAAFLAPESARAFPVDMSLTRLFDYARGSRVRIDVTVPADSLLALPAGDPNRLQMSVQFGGQVVPLKSALAPAATSVSNPWADVDLKRGTFSFNRQAEIHLPPTRAVSHRPTRIVYAIEMDVPPGDYRVVVAVQDGRSGSVAAQLGDLHAEESSNPLGEIGIGTEDVAAVIIQAPDPTKKERPAASKGKSEILPAEHSLPPKLSLLRGEPVDLNLKPSFFYTLCGPQAAPVKDGHGSSVDQDLLAGWEIQRIVTCGTEPEIDLPLRPVPDASLETGCAMMVDALPAGSLKTGSCRFEVRLERPGAHSVIRVKEFLVTGTSLSSTPSAASTESHR